MIKKLMIVALLLNTAVVYAKQNIDNLAQEYVKLALHLGQHDSAYVDAYMGPKNWQEQAKKSPLQLTEIISKTNTLLSQLEKVAPAKSEMEKLRHYYLKTQSNALVARAKMVAGLVNYTFDEESKMLFDTEAPHYKLSDFDAALSELDKHLPGQGTLPERADQFNQQFHIPKDKLSAVIDASIAECKKRTEPMVKLATDENFEVKYVTNKPYGGYNWYQGNAFSIIDINTDLPSMITYALVLGCHEGYPGHHVFNMLHEEIFVKQNNWQEFTIFPLYSPMALLAEGSANYGVDMAFPGKQKIEFEKSVLYPIAGLDPSMAESLAKVDKLKAKLKYAGNEIYRLYFDKKIDKEQAIALFMKYGLKNRKQAEQSIFFGETYGAYVINYNWGMDLVKEFIEQGKETTQAEKWQRFVKLLTQPRLPSSLNW